MKIAIMQPYFMPYIGYFQLINVVDEFIIYDQIKYTKKGWINRNKILANKSVAYITIPIQKDSDFLYVVDRYLAGTWKIHQQKISNKIKESYKNAPYFKESFSIIEKCLNTEFTNLFQFIFYSLKIITSHLGIKTKITISSSIATDTNLKSGHRIIEICKNLNANTYINPVGGKELYNKDQFKNNGIDLCFLETEAISYQQFDHEFVSALSIIDVMMFNSVDEIKKMLNNYKLT